MDALFEEDWTRLMSEAPGLVELMGGNESYMDGKQGREVNGHEIFRTAQEINKTIRLWEYDEAETVEYGHGEGSALNIWTRGKTFAAMLTRRDHGKLMSTAGKKKEQTGLGEDFERSAVIRQTISRLVGRKITEKTHGRGHRDVLRRGKRGRMGSTVIRLTVRL